MKKKTVIRLPLIVLLCVVFFLSAPTLAGVLTGISIDSSSGFNDATYNVGRLINGVVTADFAWVSTSTAWVIFDLGAGGQTFTKVRMSAVSYGGGSQTFNPTSGTLEYSDDKTTWSSVYSWNAPVLESGYSLQDKSEVSFGDAIIARYVRWTVNQSSADTRVGEFEFVNNNNALAVWEMSQDASYTNSYPAVNTVDGDASTLGVVANTPGIVYDLGDPHSVRGFEMQARNVDDLNPTSGYLYVSNLPDANFTLVGTWTLASLDASRWGSVDFGDANAVTGRYVKLSGYANNAQWAEIEFITVINVHCSYGFNSSYPATNMIDGIYGNSNMGWADTSGAWVIFDLGKRNSMFTKVRITAPVYGGSGSSTFNPTSGTLEFSSDMIVWSPPQSWSAPQLESTNITDWSECAMPGVISTRYVRFKYTTLGRISEFQFLFKPGRPAVWEMSQDATYTNSYPAINTADDDAATFGVIYDSPGIVYDLGWPHKVYGFEMQARNYAGVNPTSGWLYISNNPDANFVTVGSGYWTLPSLTAGQWGTVDMGNQDIMTGRYVRLGGYTSNSQWAEFNVLSLATSVEYYNPYNFTHQAFYPYGWSAGWQIWANDTYLNECGGNTIETGVGTDIGSYNNLFILLDKAALSGKKVIVNIVSACLLGVDRDTPSTYVELSWFVNTFKNHPALLGWLLGDENEAMVGDPDCIIDSAYLINNMFDGNHQVWQTFTSFGNPIYDPNVFEYLDGTTVYSTDLYPNHGAWYEPADIPDSFLDMQNYYDPFNLMWETAVTNNAATVLLTQGFGYVDTDQNLSIWRLPTRKEHRWNIFTAIAASGSQGTIDWKYEPSLYTTHLAVFYDWLAGIAKPAFSEQEMVRSGMETGYNVGVVDANWASKASDDSGGWTLRYDRITQVLAYDKYRNACFLIVTNNGSSLQNAQFTMSYLPAPPIEMTALAYGENSMRNLTLADLGNGSYKIVDTLQGFDTFIYRINVTNSISSIGNKGSRVFVGDNANDWSTTSLVSSSASSELSQRESAKTINGSGVSANGFMHDCDTPLNKMWLSGSSTDAGHLYVTAGKHWIQYDLGSVHSLKEMWIWNYNEYNAGFDGPSFGMKQVRVLASDTDDQTGWTDANTNPVFEGIIPKATGTSTNPVNRVIDFGNRHARYVLITSVADTNHNWSSGAYGEDGLSEVRFFKSDWDASSTITAAADSECPTNLGAVNTINGDGISLDGLTHTNGLYYQMWLSTGTAGSHPYVNSGTHWTKYSFDKIYSLEEMWIWNYNQYSTFYDGPACGMKQVRILVSTTDDSTGWTAANSTPVFEGVIPKADGTAANSVDKIVDFAGRQAKYVLITSSADYNHNWSNGTGTQDGLSEVRFYVKKPFVGDNGTSWNTTSLVSSVADSEMTERGAANTINSNGISSDGLTHATGIPHNQMWISDSTARRYATYVKDGTHWIKYYLDRVYSLKDMWIWNLNEAPRYDLGWGGPAYGMKQVRVLASVTDDQAGWTDANSHPVYEGVIPEADGTSTNPVNKVVNFAGLRARYVLITSDVGNEHNWSNGTIANDGISEVRFHIQQQASTPSPAIDAINVSLTPMLIWTIGDNATSHDVYFGTNKGNVTNATHASSEYKINQTGTSYALGTLVNNTTYYWRIDEVGPGGTTTGDIWSFTTIKAVPTFVAAGAVTSNTTAITPALPTGIATNDILLLFLETANQAITISNQNGGTWTAVANSPQGTGTAGSTSATRLTVFWSRYNGTQGNPTTSDSGDHQAGRIIAIRGAATSGNPWDVTAGGVEAVSDTSASIPGATTTVANTLAVTAIATSLPDSTSTTNFSAWTNANLTSITERVDNARSSGNGGAIGIATGIRAATGAYGNTTNTLATAAYKGMMSVAIKP